MKRHLQIIYHYTIATHYIFWMLIFDAIKVHKLLNLTIQKARQHVYKIDSLESIEGNLNN